VTDLRQRAILIEEHAERVDQDEPTTPYRGQRYHWGNRA
jgi:hypothetical protein